MEEEVTNKSHGPRLLSLSQLSSLFDIQCWVWERKKRGGESLVTV